MASAHLGGLPFRTDRDIDCDPDTDADPDEINQSPRFAGQAKATASRSVVYLEDRSGERQYEPALMRLVILFRAPPLKSNS